MKVKIIVKRIFHPEILFCYPHPKIWLDIDILANLAYSQVVTGEIDRIGVVATGSRGTNMDQSTLAPWFRKNSNKKKEEAKTPQERKAQEIRDRYKRIEILLLRT